jgi:hypothetical protein
MNGKFLLFGRDKIENSLMGFVDRKIGEQRRDEQRLAEQRTTKHRFQARKSCVADARSYRLALTIAGVSRRTIRGSNNQFPSGCAISFRRNIFSAALSGSVALTA